LFIVETSNNSDFYGSNQKKFKLCISYSIITHEQNNVVNQNGKTHTRAKKRQGKFMGTIAKPQARRKS
jgi:hypothetical protein